MSRSLSVILQAITKNKGLFLQFESRDIQATISVLLFGINLKRRKGNLRFWSCAGGIFIYLFIFDCG